MNKKKKENGTKTQKEAVWSSYLHSAVINSSSFGPGLRRRTHQTYRKRQQHDEAHLHQLQHALKFITHKTQAAS